MSTMDGDYGSQRQLSGSPPHPGHDDQRHFTSDTQIHSTSLPPNRDTWSPGLQPSILLDYRGPFFGMHPPNFSSNSARFRPLSFPASSNMQPRRPSEPVRNDSAPLMNHDSGPIPVSASNRPWEAVARQSTEQLVNQPNSTRESPATLSGRDISHSRVLFESQRQSRASRDTVGSNSPIPSYSSTSSPIVHWPLPLPQSNLNPNEPAHSTLDSNTGVNHVRPYGEDAERATAARMLRMRQVQDAASEGRYFRRAMRDFAEDLYGGDDEGDFPNYVDSSFSRRFVQVNGTSETGTQGSATGNSTEIRIPTTTTRERLRRLPRGYGGLRKVVTSTNYLESLEQPDIDSLEVNDRTCVICYNDYGVTNPEGVVETPRRLLKCKHVFGNKCLKKWLKSADSCPYCRDKLPSTFKPHHRHPNRALNEVAVPNDIPARRTSNQTLSISGGISSNEGMAYARYEAGENLGGFLPSHLTAQALAVSGRPIQTNQNNATSSVADETGPSPSSSYNASERSQHDDFGQQSYMEFIHTYPIDYRTSPSDGNNLRPSGRTLPAPQLESINSTYSPELDYMHFYGAGVSAFNRQQISPSTSIPPTRRSVPVTSSTQRRNSDLSGIMELPPSNRDNRAPWSPIQLASAQSGRTPTNLEANGTRSGSTHEPSHSGNRDAHLRNFGTSTETQSSAAPIYTPSTQNTTPPYSRGFPAGFVQIPPYYSPPGNNWEVAR